MTTIKQLDAVLDTFYESKKKDLDIDKLSKLLPEIERGTLQAICLKLNKEDYLINKGGYFLYGISWEGKFLKENGGYKRLMRSKRVEDFPKTYWWAIAIFVWLVGVATDIIKERYKPDCPQVSTQPQQVSPKGADTSTNHKTLHD